jgi:hypothetical protein
MDLFGISSHKAKCRSFKGVGLNWRDVGINKVHIQVSILAFCRSVTSADYSASTSTLPTQSQRVPVLYDADRTCHDKGRKGKAGGRPPVKAEAASNRHPRATKVGTPPWALIGLAPDDCGPRHTAHCVARSVTITLHMRAVVADPTGIDWQQWQMTPLKG